ncbi:MAG TPA: ATP-binding protein [Epsilonproteobacteria bacterium]|nr:ATP-binding protein [Campylobacterota bacterium]
MLLGFGGRNFYSFKEDFDVSLEHKNEVLSVLGIKGANASGKTNLVRAFSYIRAFMFDSFSQFQPNEGMLANSFFDLEENIELYIHFKIDNIEYKYEIVFTQEVLLKEMFSRKESRWTTMLIRENEEITECINELDELKTIKINRNNVSTISLAHQYGVNALDIFYNFSENIGTNVNLMGKMTNNEHFLGYKDTTKFYFQDKKLLNLVANLLNEADTGITQIEIIELEDEITKELTYEPLFHHKVEDKIYKLQYFEESNGTQLLYRQLGAYLVALKFGSVIAYDEFDIGLHPDLSLMLIDLFEDKEKNTNGAQLILTSHHSEVIDKLGKYRLVFVNKEENESYIYRLDEIPGDILRPDRSIMPAYNSHKIGGRPRILSHG